MKWEARGADRTNGKDRSLILDADNEAQAERRANRQGILVESVRPISPNDSAVGIPAKEEMHQGKLNTPQQVIPYAEFTPRGRAQDKKMFLVFFPLIAGIGIAALVTYSVWHLLARTPSASVVQTNTTPMATAAPAGFFASTYTIDGAAWVVKKSGDSIVLRGLQISLIGQTVPKSDAIRALQSQITADNDEAKSDESDAQDWRNKAAGDDSTADFDRERADDSAKKAQDLRAKVTTMSNAMTTFPSNVDVGLVYSVAGGEALTDVFSSVHEIALTKTDVDGKYLIAKVPAGSYYLSAFSVNDAYSIEWLVPVVINSDIHMDLSNDNAVDVHNFSN
jgi:hypothetical protein